MLGLSLFRDSSARVALHTANNYDQWLEAAAEVDHLHGRERWREQDASPFYPYQLLRNHVQRIRHLRHHQDFPALSAFLGESLHRTQGELSHPNLYSTALLGTKQLVDTYLDEVVAAIEALAMAPEHLVPLAAKHREFDDANALFGQTALLLSGGGSLGIFHLGVVKTMLEHDLLPEVIAGSSMGAIICGLVGTHTDDELLALISNPERLHIAPFRGNGLAKSMQLGYLFDTEQMKAFIGTNIRDMTFAEAYQHTGRSINIAVSPTQLGQRARILNHKLTPDVLITDACRASAAVPKVFQPVKLEARGRDGVSQPYMKGESWVDGSVHNDIPMQRLRRLYNSNHFIVSQTNPYVLPFALSREGRGVVPFAMDLLHSTVSAQCHQLVKVTKKRARGRLSRFWLDQADAIFGQDYLGDINILPAGISPQRYLKLMANPSLAEVKEFTLMGERATWPLLNQIRNETRIQRTLKNCLTQLDRQVIAKAG